MKTLYKEGQTIWTLASLVLGVLLFYFCLSIPAAYAIIDDNPAPYFVNKLDNTITINGTTYPQGTDVGGFYNGFGIGFGTEVKDNSTGGTVITYNPTFNALVPIDGSISSGMDTYTSRLNTPQTSDVSIIKVTGGGVANGSGVAGPTSNGMPTALESVTATCGSSVQTLVPVMSVNPVTGNLEATFKLNNTNASNDCTLSYNFETVDSSYVGSAPAQSTFAGQIYITPKNQTVNQYYNSTSYTVTFTSVSGFEGTVYLTMPAAPVADSCPPGAACTFSHNSFNIAANASHTETLTITRSNPSYPSPVMTARFRVNAGPSASASDPGIIYDTATLTVNAAPQTNHAQFVNYQYTSNTNAGHNTAAGAAAAADGTPAINGMPTVLDPGETGTVKVVMKNNGTKIWTAGKYFLHSANPADNSVWGIAKAGIAVGDPIIRSDGWGVITDAIPYDFKNFRVSFGAGQGFAEIGEIDLYDGNGNILYNGKEGTSGGINANASSFYVGCTPISPCYAFAGGAIDGDTITSPYSPYWWSSGPGNAEWLEISVNWYASYDWLHNLSRFRIKFPFNPAKRSVSLSFNGNPAFLTLSGPARNDWFEIANGVSADSSYAFTLPITAPHTAGSYNFQWRMHQDGIEDFDDSTANVAINISGSQACSIDTLQANGAGGATVAQNGNLAVKWSSTNAASLSASGSANFSGSLAASGEKDLTADTAVVGETKYTVSCVSPTGATNSKSVVVRVVPSPATCDINAVGTNQMIGCVFQWTGPNSDFSTVIQNNLGAGGFIIHSAAPARPAAALPSPAPDDQVVMNDNWTSGLNGVNHRYYAVWRGKFNFNANSYKFVIDSDDGSALFIDGAKKIDYWSDHGSGSAKEAVVALTAGVHELAYYWYQGTGGAGTYLSWTKVDGSQSACDSNWHQLPTGGAVYYQPVIAFLPSVLSSQYANSISIAAVGLDYGLYVQACSFNFGMNPCAWKGWNGIGGSTRYSPYTAVTSSWPVTIAGTDGNSYINSNSASGWSGWGSLGNNDAVSWGTPFRATDASGRVWQVKRNGDNTVSYYCGNSQACQDVNFDAGRSSVSPVSAGSDDAVDVYCDYQSRIDAIGVYSDNLAGCEFKEWNRTTAHFACKAAGSGTKPVYCTIATGTAADICAQPNKEAGNLTVTQKPGTGGAVLNGDNTSDCEKITLSWSGFTGSVTGYRIYRSTDGTMPAAPIKDISSTATSGSFTDSGLGEDTYYYWIKAYNMGVESAAVAMSGSPKGTFACLANIISEKDIVAVNNTRLDNWPYGYLSGGTDTLPVSVSSALAQDDTVTFSITLSNTGGFRDAANITISDKLVNLVKPSSGWNAKFNGTPVVPTEAGAEPNQTLTFNLSGSIPVGATRSLTFTAKLKAPDGFKGSAPRFQNSYTAYYDKAPGIPGSSSGTTPLFLFSIGKKNPSIIEIP